MVRGICLAAAIASLAACQAGPDGGENVPGTSPEGFTGIAEDETIIFGGTEPFWGGEVQGTQLTYSTPENPDGTQIAVERFVGQGGISFSGTLFEEGFDMTVTPGECSDGMSDRTYPYTVTVIVGETQLNGCAHTDQQPFEGPETP